MDDAHLYEKLQEQEKRNQELTTEIDRLDKTLDAKRAEKDASERELAQVKQEFDALRDILPLRIFLQTKKRLKKVRKHLFGRRRIRQLLPSQKMKQARRKVNGWKYKLELGFTYKALEELENVVRTTDNPYVERYAAWELALNYINQATREAAHKSIEYVDIAVKKEKDVSFLRRAAILKAEAHAILQEQEKGMQALAPFLKKETHPDIFLAAANLETDTDERLKWINRTLASTGIAPVTLRADKSQIPYDCLTCETNLTTGIKTHEQPKVTVIVPVYNGEAVIETALEALIQQTWSNLEIVVVDDCSTDNTISVVRTYTEKDTRIVLRQTKENSGPYIARNIGLEQATGEFVTVNDADDWSHPEKINQQATHLVNHQDVMANTTHQVRMTEDLTFFRRGQAGKYIFPNMSSLMFRRKPVMKILGYWDAVRFGADGEWKRRLKQAFGADSLVDLEGGPYAFTRQSESSLTGKKAFGYHGFFVGARKEYAQGSEYFREQADSLYYPHPMQTRPFPVPEPMWPQRETIQNDVRHFDVIIVSEFRLLGGTNMSNIEEIKAQRKMGLRTGLIQMNRYDFTSRKQINPKVRKQINGTDVQMLVYGEEVSCDTLIIRHPPVLEEWQKYLPEITPKNVCVIINQAPMRDYGTNSGKLYDLDRCAEQVKQYTGKSGKWYPIGPSVRKALLEHHQNELDAIELAHDDWVNIIHVEEWQRNARPKHDAIRIGRLSRDQYVKWPDDKATLLTIYPDVQPYEVHVLGGASVPEKTLGELPENWVVNKFGDIEPRAFLRDIDVFVYYTHPDSVEAFGRVILEAMAVGVPVIIPPSYKELFGDAAIYAEPEEVRGVIDHLMQDDERYDTYVNRAWKYVENQFGYTKHQSRLMNGMRKESATE